MKIDSKDLKAKENNDLSVLETAKPLSRSMLWKLQENFFKRKSIAAWREGIVPTYVTSNPWTAGAYARVVSGYLRDLVLQGALEFSQPVYIIELGAGSGCFAYRFLKRFLEIYRPPVFKDVPIKYIVTDFHKGNLDFILNHPRMQDYIETGTLDAACFNARAPGPLNPLTSGETLEPGGIANPVVVLANYFFDSIPQDDFYISGKKLNEVLYTLRTGDPDPDPEDPGLLDRIQKTAELRETEASHYYDDPDLDTLLEYYCRNLEDTVLQFPCTALKCLRYFRLLSGNRLMLLSGDKGYIHEDELVRGELPGFRMHGSFSLMVNYHAIGRYVEQAGGRVLHAGHPDTGLKVCAFLLGGPPDQWIETRQAYMDAIEQGGPDDFFRVKKGLEKDFSHWTLEQLTGLVRFSGFDSNIFLRCWPVLMTLAEKTSASEKEELRRIVNLVWVMHYPIGEKRDPAFCMAVLLGTLGFDEDALDYYRLSLRYYGKKAGTLYHMEQCYYRLGFSKEALDCKRQARELDPEMTEYGRMEQHPGNMAPPDQRELGIQIPGETEQAGTVLQAELSWFQRVLEARMLHYFQREGEVSGPLKLPPPELGDADIGIAKLVKRYGLSPAERLVLILALAPDIKPELLDVFFTSNSNYDRGFSEFGGILGQRHSGFIPTIETAYFLLSGGNLPLRLHYAQFFAEGHTFRRFNLLELDFGDKTEPGAGTPLRLNRDVLDMLI